MNRHPKLTIFTIALSTFVIVVTTFYLLFVFTPIPFFRYWRDIWIETAMTTGDHQWLATAFIPGHIIDDVMKGKAETNIIGGIEHLETKPAIPEDQPEATEPVEDDPKPEEYNDILGLASLKVGDKDYAGNTIEVVDYEQGLMISTVEGDGYKGKIMLIDDPSRVYLAQTKTPDVEGMRILNFLDEYDAVAGINASGFADPGGEGDGSEVIGLSCSSGKFWGEFVNYYGSVVLTESDKLVVGNITVWENYDIRDGIQFGPVLVANGKAQVTGSAGYGIQPRTAIGQREDGVIAFLIIDGRNPLHSLGTTVGELAKIFLDYDVVNASCCDGGSSTVMAYEGKVINKNSSLNPAYGRRMPNAFLVKKRTAE
nr:phosphodiester glycosidase family protein [Clostridia bacterium]